MVKTLSIDIGIKNLAFCLFDISLDTHEIFIEKWDVINILNCNNQNVEPPLLCNYINKHQSKKQKNKILCDKIAKYKNPKNEYEYYCDCHAKKVCYLIPSKELSRPYISKCNLIELCKLADKYEIKYTKPIKKCVLLNIVKTYIDENCLQLVQKQQAIPSNEKVNMKKIATNIDIFFTNLISKIDGNKIDHVIIEEQITNVMRNIQMMIMQYFVTSKNANKVDFISPTKKLQSFDTNYVFTNKLYNQEILTNSNSNTSKNDDSSITPFSVVESNPDLKIKNNLNFYTNEQNDEDVSGKLMYSKRKKLGIENCKKYLNNDNLDFINSHKKKDDLADCFLQGIWFINTHF